MQGVGVQSLPKNNFFYFLKTGGRYVHPNGTDYVLSPLLSPLKPAVSPSPSAVPGGWDLRLRVSMHHRLVLLSHTVPARRKGWCEPVSALPAKPAPLIYPLQVAELIQKWRNSSVFTARHNTATALEKLMSSLRKSIKCCPDSSLSLSLCIC